MTTAKMAMSVEGLLPLTKLVLAVSAIVQFISAVAGLFLPGLSSSFLYPPPLERVPVLGMQFFGAFYLANGIGAAYALMQNNWAAARTILSISAPFVVLCVVLTIVTALSPTGIPPIFGLYVVLSIIYIPLVAFVWKQESSPRVK